MPILDSFEFIRRLGQDEQLKDVVAIAPSASVLYQVAINDHNKNKNVKKAIPVKLRVSRL